MKTIAIVSRKGGVGKSTLTMNLAVVAGDAVILDTDPQASCADWSDRCMTTLYRCFTQIGLASRNCNAVSMPNSRSDRPQRRAIPYTFSTAITPRTASRSW